MDDENKFEDDLNESLVLFPLDNGEKLNPPATPLGKKVVTEGQEEGPN